MSEKISLDSSVCSSEKRFYNSHVLESQTNGKQVRRKTNKKIDSKKQN